jgi:hypothetical protein
VLVGHEAAREQGVHQRRAEPAREVVVAGARGAERVDPGRLAQRADRLAWRDARQRLERLRDLFPAQPEVTAAAAALRGEQSAVDEPREVPARGRGSDTGLGGEGARRQRAAEAQRDAGSPSSSAQPQRT